MGARCRARRIVEYHKSPKPKSTKYFWAF
ncbi:uncharacterized protein G2W53_014034 [Senna tora]|uniref:Uncharacterized protein n=1 Tax=Senna tora TaxID=362788 RepID=A0A834U2Y9_9FABA|nr:uncharacterized protein G2W53_014034 [Senna tora]